MKALFFVFIGGGTGSLLRYLVGLLLSSQSGTFPWKTFAVNIIGCFLLGFLTTIFSQQNISPETKLMLTTGLCGGFTTFSTFGVESLTMLNAGNNLIAFIYMAGSLILGLLAAYIGMNIK